MPRSMCHERRPTPGGGRIEASDPRPRGSGAVVHADQRQSAVRQVSPAADCVCRRPSWRRPATRRHLALPARGHVRLTARVPLPGTRARRSASSTSLVRARLGLLRHGGQLSREDAPEGLGHPGLREPDLGGDPALAPALEGQFQEAFIPTHPRDGGFVALLAAARGGSPSRGAPAGHRALPPAGGPGRAPGRGGRPSGR